MRNTSIDQQKCPYFALFLVVRINFLQPAERSLASFVLPGSKKGNTAANGLTIASKAEAANFSPIGFFSNEICGSAKLPLMFNGERTVRGLKSFGNDIAFKLSVSLANESEPSIQTVVSEVSMIIFLTLNKPFFACKLTIAHSSGNASSPSNNTPMDCAKSSPAISMA